MESIAQLKQSHHHTITIPVKWGEMDAFQHVNNTVFLRYLEDARIDLFNDMGVMEILANERQAPIFASITCDYIAPITYPDTVIVGTQLSQSGPKKIIIEQVIFSQKDNKLATKATSLCVYYDYEKLTSCVIPAPICQQIAHMNDHANQTS